MISPDQALFWYNFRMCLDYTCGMRHRNAKSQSAQEFYNNAHSNAQKAEYRAAGYKAIFSRVSGTEQRFIGMIFQPLRAAVALRRVSSSPQCHARGDAEASPTLRSFHE